MTGDTAPMHNKMLTKQVGEHWVCSVMAGYGWGVALTRDGLEHTDILGVHSVTRAMVEVQVKATGFSTRPSWPLNLKAQQPAVSEREWFLLVARSSRAEDAPTGYVVPRDHVAAATWISHRNWLTEPGVAPGKRNAGHDRARVFASVFEGYRDRWDLLMAPTTAAPVMLPTEYRDHALSERVGIPEGHPWHDALPEWSSTDGRVDH